MVSAVAEAKREGAATDWYRPIGHVRRLAHRTDKVKMWC